MWREPTRKWRWQPSAAMLGVVRDAGRAFGVEMAEVTGRGRVRPMVRARQAACWALRARWPQLSYEMVAMMLGGRDHSTVIHACRQAEVQRSRDAGFRQLTDALVAGGPIERADAPVDPLVVARIEAENAARKAGEGCAESIAQRGAMTALSGTLLAAIARAHPERLTPEKGDL